MGPTRLALGKPVIAAVEGYAVAGGLELAVWCDLRVAAEDAAFGVFCRRFGVPLIDGGTVRLPRLIGQGRALDLILTGREVGAEEALAMGLVNRVVPAGTARDRGRGLGPRAGRPSPGLPAQRPPARPWPSGACPSEDALRAEFRYGLDSLPRPTPRPAPPASRRGRGGAGRLVGTDALRSRDAPVADVAAFDFDGTLTDGGSVFALPGGPGGPPRRGRPPPRRWPPAWPMGRWPAGRWPTRPRSSCSSGSWPGEAASGRVEVSERFARHHLSRHLRAEVRDRFDWHRDRGDRVVIVSASPEVYVRVAGELLGADGVVATRLAVDGRRHASPAGTTGPTAGARRSSAACGRGWSDTGADPDRLWAYGNSRGDLRMLGAADVGVNVGRLGRARAGLGDCPYLAGRLGPTIDPPG